MTDTWIIVEENLAKKSINKAPIHVRENYDEWAKTVRTSGIAGLRKIKGYDDKELAGQAKSIKKEDKIRSSRLSRQWRVYYRADRGIVTVTVLDVNPHSWSSPVRSRGSSRSVLRAFDGGPVTPYRVRVKRTPGRSVFLMRKLQGLAQVALAKKSELEQSTISGIETGRVPLGIERAIRLAKALLIHPSVLLYPND
jgi:DNA-binding XRE family transcriptional regulator